MCLYYRIFSDTKRGKKPLICSHIFNFHLQIPPTLFRFPATNNTTLSPYPWIQLSFQLSAYWLRILGSQKDSFLCYLSCSPSRPWHVSTQLARGKWTNHVACWNKWPSHFCLFVLCCLQDLRSVEAAWCEHEVKSAFFKLKDQTKVRTCCIKKGR